MTSGTETKMPTRTVVRKARFSYSPLKPEQMNDMAQQFVNGVLWPRISKAVNCQDQPAKPLKPGREGRPGYPEQKKRVGVAPVRNWISPRFWPRGRMKLKRALQVKEVNDNRAVIGFTDPAVDRIAHILNKQDKMFGVSPKDNDQLVTMVMDAIRKFRCFYAERVG